MNGKFIAKIESEFRSYIEILDNKLSKNSINIERYVQLRDKLEVWRERFDDFIWENI